MSITYIRRVALDFDVDIVSFCAHGQPPFDEFIAPGMREIRIPKTLAHVRAEGRLIKRMNGIAANDVVMPKLFY